MTNCGKNRFLQSLRYYTVSPWIHILFSHGIHPFSNIMLEWFHWKLGRILSEEAFNTLFICFYKFKSNIWKVTQKFCELQFSYSRIKKIFHQSSEFYLADCVTLLWIWHDPGFWHFSKNEKCFDIGLLFLGQSPDNWYRSFVFICLQYTDDCALHEDIIYTVWPTLIASLINKDIPFSFIEKVISFFFCLTDTM